MEKLAQSPTLLAAIPPCAVSPIGGEIGKIPPIMGPLTPKSDNIVLGVNLHLYELLNSPQGPVLIPIPPVGMPSSGNIDNFGGTSLGEPCIGSVES